ncbi:carboxylesterase/lipase family protein [Thermodesulfobacteriota bacterium]
MEKKMRSWTGESIVQTRYGAVKGFEDERSTWSWKAIPFARPPVGPLRWKAPQDPLPWDGIREEKKYSAKSCQMIFEENTIIGSEDCLYLNIWRPQSQEQNLPVYFWIHGGGNVFQGPFLERTPGSGIASQSNVVFVSIQYRLGEFGWFSHPALRTGKPGDEYDDTGNYGTLDIIKALTWVRDNIEAFGGSPDNVLVAGESGGAFNILTLLLSQAAKNLFHKAMVQSGRQNTYSIAEGDANANAIIAQLLVNDGTVTNVSEAEAYRDHMSFNQTATYLRSKSFEEFYTCRKAVRFKAAFEDGAVISSRGFNSLDDGTYPNKVPVIIGMNKEEPKMGLFTMNSYPEDDELYETMAILGAEITKAVGRDNLLRRLRANADQPEVYGYEFLWGWRGPSGNSPLRAPYDSKIGACHTMDIPFFFNLDRFFTRLDDTLIFTEKNRKGREALSKAMMTYVAQFVRSGDPNKPGSDLPSWIPWSNDKDGPKSIMFNVDGDVPDIKMSTQELTEEGVKANLDTMAEPMHSKAKAAIAELKAGRHVAFWAKF